MSNYFGRKVLRVRCASSDLAQMLKTEIGSYFALEKISVNEENLLSIYIPRQLKDSICSLVLAILNTHQNSRKYILTDIEITSTIVLVTNLPKKISENSMDSLMKGFGRTLSKFTFFEWPNVGDKSKYGWIVFEDMEGAESCIAHIHANKLNASSLYCSLVPEHINTLEMVVMQTFTVQFEGISRKQRKREKIKNILDNVCPQICNQVQEIRIKIWKNKHDGKNYTVLVDWPTTQFATTCFKQFENFTNSYTACFALPGVCASLELQKSLESGVLVTGLTRSPCLIRTAASTSEQDEEKDSSTSPRLNVKAPCFTTTQGPLSPIGNLANKEHAASVANTIENIESTSSTTDQHALPPTVPTSDNREPRPTLPPNFQQPVNARFVVPSNHFVLQNPPINPFYRSAVRNHFSPNGHVIQRNVMPQHCMVNQQHFFRQPGMPGIQYFPPPFMSYPPSVSGPLTCAVLPIPSPPPNHFVSVGPNVSEALSGVPLNTDIIPLSAIENSSICSAQSENGKQENNGIENSDNNIIWKGVEKGEVDIKEKSNSIGSSHNNDIQSVYFSEWEGAINNNSVPSTLAINQQNKTTDGDTSCTPPPISSNTFIFKSNWSGNKSTKRWSANKKSQKTPTLKTPDVAESNNETTKMQNLITTTAKSCLTNEKQPTAEQQNFQMNEQLVTMGGGFKALRELFSPQHDDEIAPAMTSNEPTLKNEDSPSSLIQAKDACCSLETCDDIGDGEYIINTQGERLICDNVLGDRVSNKTNNNEIKEQRRTLMECLEIYEEKSRLLPLILKGEIPVQKMRNEHWAAAQIMFSNLF